MRACSSASVAPSWAAMVADVCRSPWMVSLGMSIAALPFARALATASLLVDDEGHTRRAADEAISMASTSRSLSRAVARFLAIRAAALAADPIEDAAVLDVADSVRDPPVLDVADSVRDPPVLDVADSVRDPPVLDVADPAKSPDGWRAAWASTFGASSLPLVCTFGRPSAAAWALLRGLGSRARLHVRADGDATGRNIVAPLVAEFPVAERWRMLPETVAYEEELIAELLLDVAPPLE